jgi:hypothetical protein
MTVKVGINGSGRMGRLVGTLTSGLAYRLRAIYFCLIASLVILILSWLIALTLPNISFHKISDNGQ